MDVSNKGANMKIGINSDMGEGFGNYSICDDEALMGIVSIAREKKCARSRTLREIFVWGFYARV